MNLEAEGRAARSPYPEEGASAIDALLDSDVERGRQEALIPNS